MARYLDDGEVQIENSTKVHFRNAFQQLIMIAALNVGTLLDSGLKLTGLPAAAMVAAKPAVETVNFILLRIVDENTHPFQ